jgi:iron complex outermembrane receptor protein
MKKAILPLAILFFSVFSAIAQIDSLKSADSTRVNDPNAKKIKELNEVNVSYFKSNNQKIITIGKAPIKLMDLPQSVSTINRDVIEQQQVTQLSDVVKNFNGVYIMGNTGGYQEELAGRGFAYTNSNTFKNGVRFNNTQLPEMSSLERVEVMKGSTAILFGNVAAGGIINLVTRKPLFENGGEFSVRVGSYDFYKPSIDVYGPVNNSKVAAFRINTVYENAGSFRDDVHSERTYVNPSLLFKLGKKTDLLFEGDYLNDNRTADFGVGSINYELIDVPRSRFIGVKWSHYNTQQKSASTTLSHAFNNNWQIRGVIAYQNFISDLFANQRPNGNNQFIKTNGDWIRGLQRTKVEEDYYVAQVDLTGKFNTGFLNHTLLIGSDVDKYNTENIAYNALNKYDSTNVFDPEKYQSRNDIPDLTKKTSTATPVSRAGFYVQDLMSFIDQIKLLAGVRYSYLENESDVLTFSNSSHAETNQIDRAFSPRIGVIYQPMPTMSFFGSYSTSFTPNTGVDIDGNVLPPSIIDQYEVGVKNDLLKGLLSVNVTLYQIRNSNLAQTSLVDGNTNTNIKELAGEITSRGLEVDVMTKEWSGFSVILGYSYNDTRYTKSNIYEEGSKLKYNPDHTANTSIYYSFHNSTIKALHNFNAGAGALYIGDRYAGRSTRVTVPNDSYKLIALPSYVSLEAGAGYILSNLSLRLKVTNILNVLSYNVHDDNSVNPIAPRQLMGTVTYKF